MAFAKTLLPKKARHATGRRGNLQLTRTCASGITTDNGFAGNFCKPMRFLHSIGTRCSAVLIGMLAFFAAFPVFSQQIKAREEPPVNVFTHKQHGQPINLQRSESFVLVLPNPGAGGYVVQDPEFDSDVLVLQKTDKRLAGDPTRGGDFGQYAWTFFGKRQGESSLIIKASRPWEKNKAGKVLFETAVHVRAKSHHQGSAP